MKTSLFRLLLIPGLAMTSCNTPIQVDLLVHNARIYAMDDQQSVFEAMAIRDGVVLELGPEHHILNKYQASERIDMQKQTLYPGFIDAHCHFLGYGLAQERINLVGTKSFQEVIEMVSARVANDTSKWIVGRGWDQNDWADQSFPSNEALNNLHPDRHIVLKRVDGHAMLVTKSVLDLAGIGPKTVLAGGAIDLEHGILMDEAMTLVEAVIPKSSSSQMTTAYMRAQSDCFRVGLTSVTDAGLNPLEVQVLKTVSSTGQLQMKVNAMLSASPEVFRNISNYIYEDERLRVKSVKLYADGALGSRGAKLLAPYSDAPEQSGFIICPKDSMARWAALCDAQGLQLNVHCIGDSANRMALKTMGAVLKGTNDKRWRIEHAQIVHTDDLALFGRYNVIPSVQPTHATSDMYWAETRLGADRVPRGYRYHDLLSQNGMIALGTDFPVEGIDPIKTFYAAVARKDANGQPDGGYQMDQALLRIEALQGMTIWAAVASQEENKKGSLEVGKAADFVVLSQDILTCPDSEILNTVVKQTWIDGKLVHSP